MTTSDDPDRDRRFVSPPTSSRVKLRLRPSATWTSAARTEYSALAATSSTSTIPLSRIAKCAARRCLEYLHNKTQSLERFETNRFALDVSFVSDSEIAALNTTYRGKNKPTDVLSFAQAENGAEGERFVSLGEEIFLGDVLIAVGTAHRQATELRHDLQTEIAFLTIHGILHLCGFDHDTSSRRRRMWALQDAIIERMKDEEPNNFSHSSFVNHNPSFVQ